MTANPFDLADDAAWRAWRARKLESAPTRVADLIVEVRDPKALTESEHSALLDCIRRSNMAIYAAPPAAEADHDVPRLLGRQLGLERLDANLLADDDGISPIAVAAAGSRTEFIPYTNRPIRWHTDGYYNPPERQIRGMILHCVRNAGEGGENRLLDHEIAYLLLREENPEYIRALSAPDAMTIPARRDDGGVARPDQAGPVFAVMPDGSLHMRYTARTVSIGWKDDPVTRSAVERLTNILEGALPWILRTRLEPGMGLVCNNVLHDRAAFRDDPARPRLLLRARYYDRVRDE